MKYGEAGNNGKEELILMRGLMMARYIRYFVI